MSNQDKNQKNRKAIYDLMVKDNYNLADFDSFNKELDSEEGRKELYDILSNDNYDVGDYESFNKKIYSPQGYTLDEMKATPMTERYSAAPEPSKNEKFGLDSGIPSIGETTKAMIDGRFKMVEKPIEQTQVQSQPVEPLTKLGEGLEQGANNMVAGAKYDIAETVIKPVVGTQQDDYAALGRLAQIEAEDKNVAEETKWDAKKALSPKLATLTSVLAKYSPKYDTENPNIEIAGADSYDAQEYARRENEAQADKVIRKALEESDGDVEKAKLIIATQAGKETHADVLQKAAVKKMSEAKPTKGWAWIGEMIPQMVLPATGMVLSGVTGIPAFAQVLGGVNMGVLTASTAGQAMAEARQAGASNSQVWASGIINGIVELGTEYIQYDRLTGRIIDAAMGRAKQVLGKAVSEVGSPANKELKDLLSKANKRLDGKLFSGKNVEEYIGDIAAESISEATAEGLQTIIPIIYENPENYPTFWEIINNMSEGAKGGAFMNIFLGGTSKAAEHRMNRARRKAQGYVDVAEVTTPDGKDEIVEVVRNEQNQPVFLWNGEQIPISKNNVKQRHQFNFDDFERGQFQLEEDEAYENGKTLETPAEMTDANNMYEIKAAEIRDRFGLGEDADEETINTLFNGDAFQAAMKLREDDVELSDLILDYTYAKATRDGIIDAARDRISEESAQAEAIIDYRKNKNDGMIHPATLKAKDANGNDRQVYVVSGNIVTFEDGNINTQESDNDIIIQDAVTGKPEFATAKDLLRAEQAIDPEVEKQNVRNTIADTIATEVENKMNNVLPFNVGDAYNVIGADGAEHSVQVMADNGDGSVMASIDNAEAVAMPKSEIQQLSNEYNMNRARLANEAQKEAKQSEKMMQESQNVEPTQEEVAEVAQPQIPTNEQGEPMYEQAPVADTWAELVALNEGNEEEAIDTANIMLQNAQKALDDANKTPKAKGNTVAEIQAAKAERKALIDEAQAKVDYWSNVVGYRDSQPQQVVTETAPVAEEQVTEKPSNYAERNAELGDYLDFRDYVMRAIATKGVKFIWKDSDTGTRGLRAHLGLSPKELGAHLWMLDNKVGLYPEVAAEQLLASYTEEIGGEPNIDTMDALSEILDVIGSYPNQAKMFQAAMERHGENADAQAQAEEDAIFYGMRAEAEQNGMTVEDYIIYQEYVLNEDLTHFEENYEQIIANFVESAFNEETLNQNNNERGRDNDGVPQGVHREGGLSDGGETGIGVLQTERMDDGSRDSGSVEAGQGGDVQAVEQSIDDIPATEVSGRAEEVKEKTISAPAQEADISDEDITALWIKSRDELWKPNDELGQMLHEKLYEAHPEEHQPEDRKKVVRHLIEAVEKHKDHPIAKEVLKYVKYPTAEQILFRGGEKSVQEEANSLVGVHNISLDKLKKAIKMGGLANPSVAIIDIDRNDHTDYGDYSLVLSKNMVDSRLGKNAGTWAGDAWTPTYPQIIKRISKDKDVSRFYKDTAKMPNEMKNRVNLQFDSYLEGRDAKSFYYWYLFEKGVAPELQTIPAKYSDSVVEAIDIATNGGFSLYQLSPEQQAMCVDAYIEAEYNSNRAEYEEDLQLKKERLQKMLDNPREIVRKRAQQDIEALNEYGFDYDQISSFVRDVERDARLKGQVDVEATIKASQDYVAQNNLEQEYQEWRDNLEERYGINEYIFDGFNSRGDKKYLPHTVENASKWMKKQGREGAVATFPSFGVFVATAIPRMTSLASIRKRKSQLGKTEEEYNAFREKWDDVYFNLGKKLQPNAGGFDDYGWWRLIEAIGKKNPQKYIKEEYGIELSSEDVKSLNDMLDAIQENYPARYFETKFERPVHLGEFVGAVVPNNIPSDVEAQLLNAGVNVYKYNPQEEGSRREAMLEAVDSEDIRFRSAEPAPVFYSNAEYAVKAVKQEKATPEQWLKMIEKNGGLKAGENKWLGLSDWLKASDKKTLTKQEVLDFIKENQIQIEEVVYGSLEETPRFKELRNEYKSLLVENDYNNERTFDAMVDKYGEDFQSAFEGWGNDLHINSYYGTEAADAFLDARDINDTRIQYTTDGLDNKREIALTVPTIESWHKSDVIHFGDAGNGRAIAWVRFGETTDADGNRVLVIDEVQSKRHQAGRDEGYRDEAAYRKAKEELDSKSQELFERRKALIKILEEKYGSSLYNYLKSVEIAPWVTRLVPNEEVMTREEVREYNETSQDAILQQEADLKKKYLDGIPSAPFEKNWAELAMKRMLRYAAENGFDKVAWTTGEQQAERYDISKSVDSIKSEDNNVEETSDGTLIVKNITIYAGGSVHNLFVDANGVVRGREYDGKKLSDIVGKPLAEKLMEQGDFELEGDGLRIGGEGMKAFYDQMIPSFMNKYGKKWGVKVGEVTMPSLEENNTMHSIDVTDAMRESVMQSQPMFRLSDKEQTKLAGWYDNIAERYNVSGNIQVAPSREVFEQALRDNGVAEDKLAEYDKAAYIPEKDMYLINGDSIKDNIEAERAIFHEVWHKLRKDIITLSELEWLAKSIGSNRLQALNDAFWNGKYETDEAIVDELISVSIEPYIEATVDVDGKPVSAFEAYLDNHITLNEATDAAKANMTEAANEFSDVFDKIFFETKRTLIAYKNQYYGKAQNRVPKRGEQKRTQPSTKQVLEDRPVQTAGVRGDADIKATRATRAEQRQKAIISTATDLASSLGVKMTIIEDLNEINDSNPKMRKSKRGSKAWYNITTDEVVFVAPNATSVFDAMQSVWHEVVAHKGLRDVVGREKFDAFLMKVFNAADVNTRSKIVAIAAKNGWDLNLATEEYLASLAEEGFDSRENRTFWQKVRDFFMDMLREAKIVVGYNITDNDMRYMLWRTYQMQKSQGAMAVAEDVVMQQKLGVGNFRTRPAGESMTEEEQIIADAKANGTYLKAPNGKKSNLTPKQWVQVRTKAFKKWFGDWEKAARIEKLRKSKDAEITGNEIEASEDLKQYKKNAQMYGRTLQGEYTNVDTGAVISLQRGRHNGGINEVLQHNYKDAAHLQSVAAIPQIIENGIYIESQPNKDTDTNPDVKEYQMFVCGLKIGGEDYTVLAKVAVDSKGNRYYDHNLVSVEKGKLIDIANNEQSAISSGFGTTPDTKSTTNSQRKYKELVSILQTNSSKIVDANGEPKAVWHGGQFAMSNFVPRNNMHFGTKRAALERILDQEVGYDDVEVTKGSDGRYSWKYTDPYEENGTTDAHSEQSFATEAEAYEDAVSVLVKDVVVKPYFLNIRNIEKTSDAGSDWSDAIDMAKEDGYDGISYENWYEDKGSDSYIAFNPNQIKSATDNVGTFDANNDDIRFRTTPKSADIEDGEVKGVREAFDKKVRSAWYQTKEAVYDNRQALKEYMRLATKAHGANLPNDDMKHIEAWENPYMAIMQKSSINQKEVESWEKKYYHPILNAIYKIFDVAGKRDVGALRGIFGTDSMDDILNNYLQGKHGLERNRDMAVRNALDEMTKATLITKKEAEEMLEQVNTELQNDIITPTEADARRQQIGNMLATKKFTKEQVQAQTEVWKQRKDAIRNDDTLSWAEKQRALDNIAITEFGVDLAAKDYSGLGEVFPNEDGKLEQSIENAYTAVEAFEEQFDTKDLWDAIKAANNATIEKSFRSGIINKATMDSIRDMYDYYIPLRGFEAATTEDVYGYLNNEPRAFSMPVKRANGRASKAEFAIPHILQMAHSAILQGNNNLVKMKMANFAQHYPTDLIKQSNMYIEYDEVNDVWKAKYAEIPRNATPEEVDALIAEHNEKMAKAVKENPNKYRKVSGKMDVPYIIPKGMDSYHQIPYKRNGVDYVLTVNGDPRLAFVMNGELEKAATTFAGKAGEAVEGFTRFLAGMYTQYNPEFMLSNAFRDGTWVLATVPVRENAKYTAKFYKNYFKLIVPGVMQNLFVRYEKGTLDMSNDTHREFANFMQNGGETGYAILKDVENTKKRVSKDIHPSLWSKVMKLIDKLGIVGRGVESSARFAAYITSREEGRSITRSAYDAKEVSVNFNRKGAGAAFNDLPTQTLIGQIAGATAGTFKLTHTFFNAGMQGLAGVAKLVKYNPFKATTAFSSAFLLGMVVASLYDDDDEDYYNLTETVRRQNIIIRAGDQYVSIPLAIELRAMYGLGEMMVSMARGKEDLTKHNVAYKMADQILQAFPINILEGNGGIEALLPTAVALVVEVLVNEDWQGMPIYREDKYPTDKFNPEWQMVNNYTGRGYIAASKFLSEISGGDEGTRGAIEINPAVVQHIAEGILGGPLSFFDKTVATIDIARGKKEFEWRNIPFASRIIKDGGGKAQERANNREYRNNEDAYDAMHNSEKKYEKIANDPNRSKEDREKYRLLLEELKGSPEYEQLNDFHEASLEIDKMYRDAKKEDTLDKAMPDINKKKEEANAILDNK